MGSELTARGIDTSGRSWSARALVNAPDVVRAIHRDHVRIGAQVLRTNTFRTRDADVGHRWVELARLAVSLAREAARAGVRVAGSVGPVGDCYRPDATPDADAARAAHEALADTLAAAGVDLFVCETFPTPQEAALATRVCARFGLPVWTSLTAGPDGELLTPGALADGARAAHDAGASVVLVNCVAAERTEPYVDALARLGVPFGMYANGAAWNAPRISPEAYGELVARCIGRGASVVGACCGTGLAHLEAARDALAKAGHTS
jgi:S-methylmethionine-dependent homocysteine/selenocysteine methylase